MSYCCKDKFKLQEVGDNFQLLQGGSVTSVNGKVGAVVLTAADVGALPDTYEAPVTSVNTQTGDVVLDAGDIAYESTTVEEELGTLNSALSSLSAVTEIIDTASGAIASFPDGAGLPMRSLLATIEPQQDLHGYDAPWAGGAGKNLWNPDALTKEWMSGAGNITTRESSRAIRIMCQAGDTFTLSNKNASTGDNIILVAYLDSNNTMLTRTVVYSGETSVTATAPADAVTCFACFNDYSLVADAQIEKGSTATSYAPYSNVCPITGWTGLTGAVAGKNLLPNKKYQRGTNYVYLGQDVDYNNFPIHLKAGTYTLACNNAVKASLNYKISGGTTVQIHSSRVNNYDKFTLEKDGDYQFWLYNGEGISPSDVTEFQLEVGESKTEYEVYVTPNPITCTWQTEAGTVYGGTVDVVSGLLTVTDAIVDLGTLSYTYQSTYERFNATISNMKSYTYPRAVAFLCSCFEVISDKREIDQVPYNAIYNGSGINIHIKIQGITDTTAFKNYVTGQTLVYELATPQTYQLTPQQILTLLGNNTVFVDTGSVSVTYQASIKGYIDKVLGA